MNTNNSTMQKYVSQPSYDGGYEVARWDEIKEDYLPIRGNSNLSKETAELRAKQLNEEYENENQQNQQKEMKETEESIKDNPLLPNEIAENEPISPSKKSKEIDVLSH